MPAQPWKRKLPSSACCVVWAAASCLALGPRPPTGRSPASQRWHPSWQWFSLTRLSIFLTKRSQLCLNVSRGGLRLLGAPRPFPS